MLLRLQLRLFGPEGESNILFLLMGRKEGGGSEDAAASWPRENMKRWFGPGQGWRSPGAADGLPAGGVTAS